MKYLMLIYAEVVRRGVNLMGSRPASDATSVQVRDGELSITDGPFAEAKEQFAGFDAIELRPFWPFGED